MHASLAIAGVAISSDHFIHTYHVQNSFSQLSDLLNFVDQSRKNKEQRKFWTQFLDFPKTCCQLVMLRVASKNKNKQKNEFLPCCGSNRKEEALLFGSMSAIHTRLSFSLSKGEKNILL